MENDTNSNIPIGRDGRLQELLNQVEETGVLDKATEAELNKIVCRKSRPNLERFFQSCVPGYTASCDDSKN
jgi:hypothetical protein